MANCSTASVDLDLEPTLTGEKRARLSSPVTVDLGSSEPGSGICFFCFACIKSGGIDVEKLKVVLIQSFRLPIQLVESVGQDSVCETCQICLELYHSIFVQIQNLEDELKKIEVDVERKLRLKADHDVIERANATGQLDALLNFRQETCRLRYAEEPRLETESPSGEDFNREGNDYDGGSLGNSADLLGVQHNHEHTDITIVNMASFASMDDPPDCMDFSDQESQLNRDLEANVESSVDKPENSELNVSTNSITCNYIDPLTKKCTLKFGNILKLEAHLKSHTLRVRLEKSSVESRVMKRRNKLSRRKIKCAFPSSKCGMIPRRGYPNHVRKLHGYVICESFITRNKKCYEIFETEELLQNHQRYRHVEQQLFKRDQHITSHPERLVESNEDLERIVCQVCTKQPSLFRSMFPGHMSRHKYFTCLEKNSDGHLCCCTFSDVTLLQAHFEIAHGEVLMQGKEMQFAVPLRHMNSGCPACGKAKLKDSKQFRDHLTLHGFFPCGQDLNGRFCKRFFRSQERLELHKPNCKYINPQLDYNGLRMECRFCKVFILHEREAWERHITSHNAYVCNWVDPNTKKVCNRVEISEQLIRLHRKTKHGVEPEFLTSAELETIPGTANSASESIQSPAAAESLQCVFCLEICGSFSEWKSHIEGHGTFVCEVVDPVTGKQCNEVLISEGKLALHCRNVHTRANAAVAPYVCPECKYCAKTQSLLTNHMKIHVGPQPEICELCGKSCPSLQSLRRHKVNVHGEPAAYYCPNCNKGFIRAFEMKEHIKFIHEGATVSCTICKATFNSKAKLNVHRTTVHGEKATCADCGKEFQNTASLYGHRRSAHAERKYPCTYPQCGWSFALKGALVRHISSVHENMRPFVCDICGVAMKNAGQLRCHRLKHEKGTYRGSFASRMRRLKTPPPTC